MDDTEEGKEMSFLDHLEELRWHLVRSFFAVLIFSVLAFIFKDFVWDQIILAPSKVDFWTFQQLCALGNLMDSSLLCIEDIPMEIINRKMEGQFVTHIKSSFFIGLLVAFPYIFWEIWRFVKPGLHRNERKASRGVIGVASLLFLLGALFGYYIVTPLSINFLSHYELSSTIDNTVDVSSYVNLVSMLILACALMFQLPMVSYFLSKAGIVTPSLMKQYRRHSLVVILVLSAVITPPDIISQLLIAAPLSLLYEVSISISRRIEKRKLKEEALN